MSKNIKHLRINWLDDIKVGLIFSMVLFHFYWDLLNFNLINFNPKCNFFMIIMARITAAGFLALSGFNIAIQYRIKPPILFIKRYFIRFAKIALCACLISLVTYFYSKTNFVYFGILHNLALSSLLILPILITSFWLDLAIALIILYIYFFTSFYLLHSFLYYWTGLTFNPPASLDFVLIFPWLFIIIIGLTLGKTYKFKTHYRKSYLKKISQHSLSIYMLHQPILFIIFLLITQH